MYSLNYYFTYVYTYSKVLIDRREYCQGTLNAVEITENRKV